MFVQQMIGGQSGAAVWYNGLAHAGPLCLL